MVSVVIVVVVVVVVVVRDVAASLMQVADKTCPSCRWLAKTTGIRSIVQAMNIYVFVRPNAIREVTCMPSAVLDEPTGLVLPWKKLRNP